MARPHPARESTPRGVHRDVPPRQPREALARRRPAHTGRRRRGAPARVDGRRRDAELPARGRRTLGIGADDLRAASPDLVYLSITGFGTTGPLAELKVYDNLVQAVCGLASDQGRADGEPAFVANLACDKITALTAAQAVTAALFAARTAVADSTSSCRCSTRRSRSCGPTPRRATCCWATTSFRRAHATRAGSGATPTGGARARR